MSKAILIYYGCRHEILGNQMYRKPVAVEMEDRRFMRDLPKRNPWSYGILDGGLCPKWDMAEGSALLHHRDGWTALSFWDQSVDLRPGGASTFLAEAVLTFNEILKLALKHFAEVTDSLRFDIRLVSRPDGEYFHCAGMTPSVYEFQRAIEQATQLITGAIPDATGHSDAIFPLYPAPANFPPMFGADPSDAPGVDQTMGYRAQPGAFVPFASGLTDAELIVSSALNQIRKRFGCTDSRLKWLENKWAAGDKSNPAYIVTLAMNVYARLAIENDHIKPIGVVAPAVPVTFPAIFGGDPADIGHEPTHEAGDEGTIGDGGDSQPMGYLAQLLSPVATVQGLMKNLHNNLSDPSQAIIHAWDAKAGKHVPITGYTWDADANAIYLDTSGENS